MKPTKQKPQVTIEVHEEWNEPNLTAAKFLTPKNISELKELFKEMDENHFAEMVIYFSIFEMPMQTARSLAAACKMTSVENTRRILWSKAISEMRYNIVNLPPYDSRANDNYNTSLSGNV